MVAVVTSSRTSYGLGALSDACRRRHARPKFTVSRSVTESEFLLDTTHVHFLVVVFNGPASDLLPHYTLEAVGAGN
jgi:hypothetical protein